MKAQSPYLFLFFLTVFSFTPNSLKSQIDIVQANEWLNQAEIASNTGQLPKSIALSDSALMYYRLDSSAYQLKIASAYLVKARSCLYGGFSPITELSFMQAARKYTDIALRIFQKNYGENHVDIARCYLALSDVVYYESNSKARRFYAYKAKSIYDNVGGDNATNYSLAYQRIAESYIDEQNHDSAIIFSHIALTYSLKGNGINHIQTARCYGTLGNYYRNIAEWDSAITYLEKTKDIFIQLFGNQYIRVGQVQVMLGICHYNKGYEEDAIADFEQGIEAYKKAVPNGIHQMAAFAYSYLGTLYSNQGNTEKGYYLKKKGYEMLLTIKKGLEDGTVAFQYAQIGQLFENTGDYKQAIVWLQKAYRIDPNLFDYIASLCWNYVKIGQLDSAAAYIDRLMALSEKRPMDLQKALSVKGYYHYIKKEYDLAQKVYKEGINVAVKNKDRFNETLLKISLAVNFSAKGEYDTATKLFSEVEQYKFKYNYINQIELYDAYILNFQRQYASTRQPQYLTALIEKSKKALDVLESIQKQIIDASSKQKINEHSASIFERSLEACLQLQAIQPTPQYLAYAWHLSETRRGQTLYDNLRDLSARQNNLLPKDKLESETKLKADISRLQQEVVEAQNDAKQVSKVNALEARIFDKRQQLEQLIQFFEKNYPNYYRLKYDRKTMTVTEVQSQILQPKQTLLEYFAGDSTITIFVVGKDKYDVKTVKNDFGLDSLVKQLRTSLTSDRSQGAKRYSDAALLLYQKLIAPVKAQLTENVVIIPDGVLSYIPFEALLVEPPKEVVRFKTHHYLLRDHRINYCFSATLLREMMQKQHATPPTVPLMAFAPFFEGDTVQLSTLFSNDADIAERDATTLVPLKYTGEEAYKVASLLKGEAIVGKAATEARFTEGGSKARIIHLATHAKADDRSGDYSYLAFSPQKDTIQNELVYVRDLYNLRLNADLVVLSACETGIGKLQRGEGVISLARAFAYSGAKAIVTSIWSVNDAKTKDLMVLFYQNLKRGQPKNEALRQAKLKYLETHKPEECHPYFWSGFINIGDQSTLR